MNSTAQPTSGINQKAYMRLKTSLQLNLRRQIFLAVCDDLELRSQLVSQLQRELSPRFVSLNLNLADPNPLAQVSQWLNQRASQTTHFSPLATGFQILGIEHLTRQPAPVQKRFLTHLQAIEYYMPSLECTTLLWIPRPWLRSIRQSAPTFWEWHTALFEFEGDPTPLRPVQAATSLTQQRPAISTQASVVRVPLAKIEASSFTQGDIDSVELEETALLREPDALPDALWEILTQDLDRWDVQPQSAPIRSKVVSAELPAASINVEPQSTVLPIGSTLPVSPLKQLLIDALNQSPEAEQHQAGLASLQQIEALQQQNVPLRALASAYYGLGRAYRECIEQGDSSEQTLGIAIAAHRQTLELLEGDSSLKADVANDLGNLYWMRSRNVTTAELQLSGLEQAIEAYHIALQHADVGQPQTCAMIQNNLGSAYGDLAQYREPAANLQKSIQAYEAALQQRAAEAEPARYAATQNNLGTAYWNLAQYDQPINWLKRSIAAYQEALRYYTPETEPLSYAMIQNNIGTAYWNLAQHIQPTKSGSPAASSSPEMLLRLAIAAYQNALIYRTLQAAPAAYAATQNNLGTAFWDLTMLPGTAISERREQFQLAITAYEAAIAAVAVLAERTTDRPALTFDVFATHNNLGLAYYHLAMDRPVGMATRDRQQALETALKHHLKALQGWESMAEFQASTLDLIVQTVRALFSEFGIQGQNLALSQIPPNFLPQVMSKL
jgi:tetratricopeptide (TPR) repeat protein